MIWTYLRPSREQRFVFKQKESADESYYWARRNAHINFHKLEDASVATALEAGLGQCCQVHLPQLRTAFFFPSFFFFFFILFF